MAKISKLISCHAVGLGHMSRYMRVVYGSCSFKVHQFILKTGGFYKLREARARFKRLLMWVLMLSLNLYVCRYVCWCLLTPSDDVTFKPSLFYLKYWISPNKHVHDDYYYELSLRSYAILQGVILTGERIKPNHRSAISILCRIMHEAMVAQIPDFLRASNPYVVSAVGHAIHSVYSDLMGSKDDSESQNAEACKQNSLKHLSSRGLIVNTY